MQTAKWIVICSISGASLLHSAASGSNTPSALVSYGTYFGGSSDTQITAIATDTLGDVYLAGWTRAQDLPMTTGTYQSKAPGCSSGPACTHAFVAKLTLDGALLWTSYLGGTTYDAAIGVAVDANGVYVAGNTTSVDFPVTPDAFQQPAAKGGGFLAKLDVNGSRLIYSTFIPLDGTQSLTTLALGPQGTLVVAGSTDNAALPTLNAYQPQYPGGSCGSKYGPQPCVHAFFAAWRSLDMKMLFASFLGGTGNDAARGATIDAGGNIYLTGATSSADFPLLNPLQSTPGAGNCPDTIVNHYPSVCTDAFVMKFTADGRTLLYSTRLGGAAGDSGNAIVLDTVGEIVVAGTTASPDFPMVHAVQTYPGPGVCISEELTGGVAPCPHAFVAKFNLNGSALVYSTYISGKSGDAVTTLLKDPAGNLYVAGYTMSSGFPITGGALRHCNSSYSLNRGQLLGNDGTDGISPQSTTGFLVQIDDSGAPVFSTYFGGTGNDQVLGLAPDGRGGLYLAGGSQSPDLPTTSVAIQPLSPDYAPPANGNGPLGSSGFLIRLSFSPQPPPPQVDPGCILNAASFQAGALAPGEIVTLFGAGLGPAVGLAGAFDAQGRIATALGGTTVFFDGVPAPLLYVGANQINAIVPFEVGANNSTRIVVDVNFSAMAPRQAAVAPVSPGVFTVDLTGTGQAVVLNQDGTLNSSTSRAPRGSAITLWVTGMGALSQSYTDGEIPVSNLGTVKQAFQINLVTPGSFPLNILYAGQAPDLAAGVVQLNAVIPPDVPAGLDNVDFILQVTGGGGSVFANPVTIWLR